MSLSESVLSSASSSADALTDARIVPATKAGYQRKIDIIREFYKEHLLSSFTLPVNEQEIRSFFGWLTTHPTKRKDQPPAFSTVRQYKSALVWYYQECKFTLLPELNQSLELLLNGYKRKVSSYKLEGKMPVFEGKYHLTFDGYCLLASTLLVSQMLFGWPYLVLQWNLIARTATVSGIMMEHVGWEGDSLLVSTPKHKGDQEGVKCFSRHLYANPLNPAICPVLALAVLTFTRVLKHDPQQSSSSTQPNYRIFDGEHSEQRFSEVLGRTISSLAVSDLPRLGGDKKQLGTHSVRKGASSYCSGMINGPSTVQVFLRAGWSLGNVQDRYLFAGAGGDQVTGRVLSGLPFNDSSFASLPPHFGGEGLARIQWASIFPLYDRVPETFKRALPFLLASICYHEPWLRSTLPAQHPLFSTYLFASGCVDGLKPLLHAGRSRCAATSMLATGIPTHLAMSSELTDVVKATQLLRAELLAKCSEMPAELVTVMLNRFSINGAIPVTVEDIKALLNDVLVQMRSELRDALPAAAAHADAPQQPADPADPRFLLHQWGGRFHMVKEGWQLVSTDVKSTWNLWHFGHLHDRIRPLRCLESSDLDGTRAQRNLLSKVTGVMTAVADMMVEMKLVESRAAVTKLSAADSSAAFDKAIVALMERVKGGATGQRGRWTEMAIPTMYEHVCNMRKRKRQETEAKEREEEEEEKE